VEETWKAAERTFESVLSLQQDFPELIFCHSTPALYEWVEQNRPDMFQRIQQQIEAGRWEPVGGLWVEPELNIIGGEAIARHILYGQRYLQQKFGSINPIAWLPDSFGFNWQLPQFLKQGGIDYFVTQKLRWNDTTRFPYDLFQWQAPDGSQVCSLMSAPIGEGIDPIKMATYACDWEQKTGIPHALWLPGVGDHGGGPTRDMLELAQRWARSPFFPQIQFTTAQAYLEQVSGLRCQVSGSESEPSTSKRQPRPSSLEPLTSGSQASTPELHTLTAELEILPSSLQAATSDREVPPSEPQISPFEPPPTPSIPHPSSLSPCSPLPLPPWNSELYLEFHRGCYTTHGDQKQFNHQCEDLLYQAELWASLATLSTGAEYPKAELETAWKEVLFNQFHDILPGTSITQVFDDANKVWFIAHERAWIAKQKSLREIVKTIALPASPHPDAEVIAVFNALNWNRIHAAVCAQVFSPGKVGQWRVLDMAGQEVKAYLQCSRTLRKKDEMDYKLYILPEDIPAIGYRCFWVCPNETNQSSFESIPDLTATEDWVLENEFLSVTIDPATGELARVFDTVHQKEVLSGAGNQLQVFEDKGQYWDAWNIDPNYADHPLPGAELVRIQYQERGELINRIEVVRRIGQSDFYQVYTLQKGSPVLSIETTIPDWQERHILVKAAFPLTLEAEFVTYEIPCGAIQRTTRPITAAERAQWEVPALRWADLGDGNYGVSLLTDCKHGFDSQPNQLRLTLLRGSEFPDPDADRGTHHFTYALYPHRGNWQTARTVQRACELNQPLQVVQLPPDQLPTSGNLPPVGQLLNLGADNLMLTAFKQSEDSPDEWILRCYECHGEAAELNFSSSLNLSLGQAVDLLERPTDEINVEGQTAAIGFAVSNRIAPWKIASFKVVSR
jgi:alpha-mannosidase